MRAERLAGGGATSVEALRIVRRLANLLAARVVLHNVLATRRPHRRKLIELARLGLPRRRARSRDFGGIPGTRPGQCEAGREYRFDPSAHSSFPPRFRSDRT